MVPKVRNSLSLLRMGLMDWQETSEVLDMFCVLMWVAVTQVYTEGTSSYPLKIGAAD